MTYYAGFDVSMKTTFIAIMDEKGNICRGANALPLRQHICIRLKGQWCQLKKKPAANRSRAAAAAYASG